MAQISTTDEEKKKREGAVAAPSYVSGSEIAARQASNLSGSRPAIYDGQPETASGYGKAARALVGDLPPLFNDAEKIGPSTQPSIVGKMVSSAIAGEQSKLKALNQYDTLPQASYSNEGRSVPKPVTAAAPSIVSTEQTTAAAEQPDPAAVPQTLSPTADLQARSNASAAILGAAQQAAGMKSANGNALENSKAGLNSIANNEGVREAFNGAQQAMGTGIMYGVTTGADGKPQTLISGGEPTKAQYIDANGQPTNDWTKTAQYAQGIATAGRMKELAAQIPERTGPAVASIADTGRAESQALQDKWARDGKERQVAALDPRVASAIAPLVGAGIQADTVRRGQDIQQEMQAGNLAVSGRDAGSREQIAAADAGLKATQSKGIMADIDKKAELVALQQRAANGDKAALEILRAMTGHGGRDGVFKGLHAAGGTTIDPSTGQVVKSPDSIVLYNEQTGQVQQLGSGQAGSAPAAKAPAVGEVRGGYKFKDGNPADKSAWEKV